MDESEEETTATDEQGGGRAGGVCGGLQPTTVCGRRQAVQRTGTGDGADTGASGGGMLARERVGGSGGDDERAGGSGDSDMRKEGSCTK